MLLHQTHDQYVRNIFMKIQQKDLCTICIPYTNMSYKACPREGTEQNILGLQVEEVMHMTAGWQIYTSVNATVCVCGTVACVLSLWLSCWQSSHHMNLHTACEANCVYLWSSYRLNLLCLSLKDCPI